MSCISTLQSLPVDRYSKTLLPHAWKHVTPLQCYGDRNCLYRYMYYNTGVGWEGGGGHFVVVSKFYNHICAIANFVCFYFLQGCIHLVLHPFGVAGVSPYTQNWGSEHCVRLLWKSVAILPPTINYGCSGPGWNNRKQEYLTSNIWKLWQSMWGFGKWFTNWHWFGHSDFAWGLLECRKEWCVFMHVACAWACLSAEETSSLHIPWFQP